MVWHLRFGTLVFALLRSGCCGASSAGTGRASPASPTRPPPVLRYLRGQSRAGEHHHVGHNPLGALSVFGLLAMLAAQVGTGLFADDEIADTGPLVRLVSDATSHLLTAWHKHLRPVAHPRAGRLHLGAVAVLPAARRSNLVGPC